MILQRSMLLSYNANVKHFRERMFDHFKINPGWPLFHKEWCKDMTTDYFKFVSMFYTSNSKGLHAVTGEFTYTGYVWFDVPNISIGECGIIQIWERDPKYGNKIIWLIENVDWLAKEYLNERGKLKW